MTPLAQKALQIAKAKVGQREATGRNDGPFVRLLQRWAAKGGVWLDNQPWCVMYATWAVWEAARVLGTTSLIPERASSSRLYAWAKKHGRLLKRPVDGCIGLVRRGGAGDQDGSANRGKTHIHCFLVHTVEPSGRLVTLEGNWRNSVGWNHRKTSEPLDYVEIC